MWIDCALSISLEHCLNETYAGLFCKGFDRIEVENRGISIGLDPRFFVTCLNDPSKIQINALNQSTLDKGFDDLAISSDDRAKINALFIMARMNDEEVKKKCVELRPLMSELFDVWSDSAMKSFSLTSVGIAIGHANVQRLVGPFANLSIWIN